VGFRKPSGPAAGKTARKPRAEVPAGQRKLREVYTTPLLSVYDGRQLLGFLLPRGKQGVEAFSADDRSLGVYPDQRSAAAAVSANYSGERS
jgi:hypothetical protein